MFRQSILTFFLSCTLVFTLAAQQSQTADVIPDEVEGYNREQVINQLVSGRIQQIAEQQQRIPAVAEIEEFTKIIMFVVGAALTYGILHDQFTVRVNRDYFCADLPGVQHHRNGLLRLGLNPDTLPNTAVACVWGVLATWLPGMILAFEAAMVARFGTRLPKLSWQELVKPILYAMAGMGTISLCVGLLGYISVTPVGPYTRSFQFNADAHATAYQVAALIAFIAPAWIIYQRALKLEQKLLAV